MGVRKFHGNWIADYVDQFDKRHREKPEGKFENKALQKLAAQELLTKRLGEVEKDTYHAANRRRTVSDLCDDFLNTHTFNRPSTERSYRASIEVYIRSYFGRRTLASVRSEDVDRFKRDLIAGYPRPIAEALAKRMGGSDRLASARRVQARAKLSNASINQHLRHLHVLLEYALARRWVDFNAAAHFRSLPVSPRSTVMSIEEMCRVMPELKGPQRDANGVLTSPSANWSLMIRLAMHTGMRQGEILGLQWHDLHATNQALYVSRAWKDGKYHDPKTKNGFRWVEVPQALMDELRRWQTELRNIGVAVEGHDPIFPTGGGKPQSHANVLQRGWYPALKRAGIYDWKTKTGKHVRFHDLRRTAVSLMRDLGVTEGDISATTGHSIAVMRAVYSHPLPKERRGGTDAIAAVLSKSG